MELSTKLGDTAPLPRYQLIDRDGQPADLTGAAVVQRFAGAPAAGSACGIDGDPADGIVRLASRDDLPVVPPRRSSHLVRFETEVTFGDGTVQTYPTVGYDRWQVWSDLDGEAAS